MKFTIDTEKKVIYFKESFTKDDIEYLFTLLKIEGIETWKIDMEHTIPFWGSNPTITSPNIIPYTVPNTGDPYIFPNTGNPYIYCQSDTIDISNNTSDYFTTTNTMSFSLSEN